MKKIKLPAIVPPMYLSKNVAIVGSSARLNDSLNGKLIDGYDEVIRFNRAVVDGYENNVGNKTSLRIVNNPVFNGNNLEKEGYSNAPPDFIKNLKNTNLLYCARDLDPWRRREKLTDSSCDLSIVNYHELDILKKIHGVKINKDFSIGTCFIFLCIASGITPHLFGIDIEEGVRRTHYWEERPSKAGPCHAITDEKKWLQKLIKGGIVVYN